MGNSTTKTLDRLASKDPQEVETGLKAFEKELDGGGGGLPSTFYVPAFRSMHYIIIDPAMPPLVQASAVHTLRSLTKLPQEVLSADYVSEPFFSMVVPALLNALFESRGEVQAAAVITCDVLTRHGTLGRYTDYASACVRVQRLLQKKSFADDAAYAAFAEQAASDITATSQDLWKTATNAETVDLLPTLIRIMLGVLKLVSVSADAARPLLGLFTQLISDPLFWTIIDMPQTESLARTAVEYLHEFGAVADVSSTVLNIILSIMNERPEALEIDRLSSTLSHHYSTLVDVDAKYEVMSAVRHMLRKLDFSGSQDVIAIILLKSLVALRPIVSSVSVPPNVGSLYSLTCECLDALMASQTASLWCGRFAPHIIEFAGHDLVFCPVALHTNIHSCVRRLLALELSAPGYDMVAALTQRLLLSFSYVLNPANRKLGDDDSPPSHLEATAPEAYSVPALKHAFAFLSEYEDVLNARLGGVGETAAETAAAQTDENGEWSWEKAMEIEARHAERTLAEREVNVMLGVSVRLVDTLVGYLHVCLTSSDDIRDRVLVVVETILAGIDQKVLSRLYTRALAATCLAVITSGFQADAAATRQLEEEIGILKEQLSLQTAMAQSISVAHHELGEKAKELETKYDRLESGLVCAICLDSFLPNRPSALPCGHIFCRECIEGVARADPSRVCPQCRHPFGTDLRELKGLG